MSEHITADERARLAALKLLMALDEARETLSSSLARWAEAEARGRRQGLEEAAHGWTYCPMCGKVLVHLTPENRGIRPLPGIPMLTEHADTTPLCALAGGGTEEGGT